MNSLILGLLAETSIHPGAGQSAGFLDLPVAREAATDYPVIVGSSMKGALLDMAYQSARCAALAEGKSDDEAKKIARAKVEAIFGKQDNAGTLLVSDARLILLPVRSLKTQYKWVTCPHLIERLSRDRARENCLTATPTACAPGVDSLTTLRSCLTATTESNPKYLGADDGELFLEERQFSRATPQGDLPEGLIELVRGLIPDQPHYQSTRDRIASQLVVISNDDFVWFARYGLAVNARNKLDETKKTSKNLWYEETIPPDALFYCLLAQRNDKAVVENDDALMVARKLFECRPYLQVGGNETVGQGWFAVALPKADQANGGAA
ncbi:MAG: type III-B CRISPR module RAMP protein Cmr4 [Planctomycetia bacterium]|nr:type III-B CRISPR module RAMP protein Cmr4 [Planctomycetia bacterium]